jgi:hypothetical protein
LAETDSGPVGFDADEKNEKKKETIRKRADEYMKRAEQIKDALKSQSGGGAKATNSGGAGGSATRFDLVYYHQLEYFSFATRSTFTLANHCFTVL